MKRLMPQRLVTGITLDHLSTADQHVLNCREQSACAGQSGASSLFAMYVPGSNAMTDGEAIRAFVSEVGVAELVTVGLDGFPEATLLPIVWNGDRVIAHFARANPHWRSITAGAPTLLTVRGSHGYISPSWYPSKKEHGRAVPTWNYSAVQIRGTARVFDDEPSLREAVALLTDLHEATQPEPWHVDDAPSDFINGMLRAIVGIEIAALEVVAKAKLSQNRPEADQSGVIAGLRATNGARGELELAQQMDASLLRETS